MCWANYSYTHGSCGTAIPVWDMQTNTWVIVSPVNGDSSTMGSSTTWAVVISKNFVPDNGYTCNGAGTGGVNCLFDNNYENALKIIKNDPMITNDLVDWKLNEWVDSNQ